MARVFLFAYLAILHLGVVLMLWKSDFLQRVGLHLGIPQTWGHYEQMMMYHRWMDPSVPDGAVVFIGDSLTQGLAVAAVAPNAVNYGIGGDTVSGVGRRLPEYRSLARAAAVVLAIGVNDLPWRDDATILESYRAALDALPRGPQVLVCGVLPVASPSEAIRLEEAAVRIRGFNRALRTLAESRGARFVDATAALADPTGRLRREHDLGDGLHLSPAGYSTWIEVLRLALDLDITHEHR